MATGITALSEDKRSKCVVCKQMAPRYRCPRCMIRTCSLPCVKRHKAERGCTGVRDKSAYKHTSKITDLDLLNDYRFLEDVGRKAEASSRDSLNSYQQKLPWHLKGLINQAKKRRITLQLLPRKFSKRRKNNTKYYHASKAIIWTVEWVFPLADGKHYDRHMDTDTIQASLEKIFSAETDSVVRHKLRGYVQHGLDDVTLLLKKEGCPANDQRYYELHRRKTISQSLRDKVIIEYPTIYVVYGHQAAAYPRAEPTNSQISSAEEEDCSVEDRDDGAKMGGYAGGRRKEEADGAWQAGEKQVSESGVTLVSECSLSAMNYESVGSSVQAEVNGVTATVEAEAAHDSNLGKCAKT